MEITTKDEVVTEKCLVVERDMRAFNYPQLTASNYTSWMIRVEAMMEAQGVWEVIELEAGKTVDVKKDRLTRVNLLQVLPEDLLMQVEKNKTAKEVWECLKMRFVGEDRVKNARVQTLKSDFDAMRMKEEETLDQYTGRLNGMSVRYAQTGVWYLDNGASNHMTGDRRYFYELNEGITGKVKFGDDSSVQITGKGSALFNCRNGDHWLLREIYFIPRLRRTLVATRDLLHPQASQNIISLGKLTKTGHRVILDKESLVVQGGSPPCLLMKVRRTQNFLYRIELEAARSEFILANLEDEAWLWHARFGHVNFQALRLLLDKRMAVGVPTIVHPNKLCQGCLVAKQTREFFPLEANFKIQ